jgi:hypothetical protein
LPEQYGPPNFWAAVTRADGDVWDPEWWARVERRDDLPGFLIGYLTSLPAVRAPLFVMGAPGSGKTLLLKMLMARLPPDDYTTVLVPLRDASVDAPVHVQAQAALDRATNGRLTWADIAAEADARLRVLLVDGIDDLWSDGPGRPNYLEELAEFQRIETQLGYPVTVIVTGRPALSGRLTIPDQTVAILLEKIGGQQTTDP